MTVNMEELREYYANLFNDFVEFDYFADIEYKTLVDRIRKMSDEKTKQFHKLAGERIGYLDDLVNDLMLEYNFCDVEPDNDIEVVYRENILNIVKEVLGHIHC